MLPASEGGLAEFVIIVPRPSNTGERRAEISGRAKANYRLVTFRFELRA